MTLLEQNEGMRRAQVAWLADLLSPRGMPGILLEYQLESLGRIWRREGLQRAEHFFTLAAEWRSARLSALDADVFVACERLCADAARGDARRRGAGTLIAASIADRANGRGDHSAALISWFTNAVEGEAPWALACRSAGELAVRELRVASSGGP